MLQLLHAIIFCINLACAKKLNHTKVKSTADMNMNHCFNVNHLVTNRDSTGDKVHTGR